MVNKIRTYLIISLFIVTPLGFLCKLYTGPWHSWVNNYAAGVLYEIFWITLIFFFIPDRKHVNKIPVWVFMVTCIIEVLQLWHPLFLQKIRSYFIGRTLIGTSFSWWDFPHYAVGCIIGWLFLKRIYRTYSGSKHG